MSRWEEKLCADNTRDFILRERYGSGRWRRMKGEWHAQCQMCTFPVAKYFSSCIPVISEAGGEGGRGAERIPTRGRQIWSGDPAVGDVPAQGYAGTELPPVVLVNATRQVRQKLVTENLRVHFCRSCNYFKRSDISQCKTYKQQDRTGLLKTPSETEKGELKFKVKFTPGSHLLLETRYYQ